MSTSHLPSFPLRGKAFCRLRFTSSHNLECPRGAVGNNDGGILSSVTASTCEAAGNPMATHMTVVEAASSPGKALSMTTEAHELRRGIYSPRSVNKPVHSLENRDFESTPCHIHSMSMVIKRTRHPLGKRFWRYHLTTKALRNKMQRIVMAHLPQSVCLSPRIRLIGAHKQTRRLFGKRET